MDIQKGLFRIERLEAPTMIRIAIRVESDYWVSEDTRKNLSMEINAIFGVCCKTEIKKTLRKMIKDLEWLLANMPADWK